jgi:hypothetical protein
MKCMTRNLSAATVFLGAGLLFLVQPILAKMILPWFGGAAGVWSVCLFFFQAALLGGYLYAHCFVRWVPERWHAPVHTVMLALACFALPIVPDAGWKPGPTDDPLPRILGLLATTIGAPYLLLASTSPLVQAWYARASGAKLPYRLFALSNVASLAALLVYPLVIEPFTTARVQAAVWSVGFVLYGGLVLTLAWKSRAGLYAAPKIVAPTSHVPVAQALQWVLFAAVPTALLAAVTHHICENVASIPFLWILPLSVYLVTFILCFDRESVPRWAVWPWLAGLGVVAGSVAQLLTQLELAIAIPAFLGVLFFLCMYFHARLAASKPEPGHLTTYYLMISIGGAIGSLLTGVVAPITLSDFHELPITISIAAMLLLFGQYGRSLLHNLKWVAVAIAAVASAQAWFEATASTGARSARGFYGVLKLVEQDQTGTGRVKMLVHGAISHGSQILDPARASEATTYYAPGSGVGRAMKALTGLHRKIGLIGLGVGTLAAYGRAGDEFRFYEINPQDAAFARDEFTFLRDSAAHTEVLLGDGRLTLEAEPAQGYDLLVVDAFSGDSIPAHLLSVEAFRLYVRHVKGDGLLAFHVSNDHLDLAPVVGAVARAAGMGARLVNYNAPAGSGASSSSWVITGPGLKRYGELAQAGEAIHTKARAWTDDFSNLLTALR